MGWNVNSLSDYKTQVKFINKLKSAPENCFNLSDTRLGSDSEKVLENYGENNLTSIHLVLAKGAWPY